MLGSATDTLLGGLIAAAAGLLAVLVAGALAEKARRRSAEEESLQRSARVAGRTLSFLRDANPDAIIRGIPVDGGDPTEVARETLFNDLWPRWNALQDELESLRVADSREPVRKEVDLLIETCRLILTDSQYFALYRADQPMTETERARVVSNFEDAQRHAERLVAVLQGFDS